MIRMTMSAVVVASVVVAGLAPAVASAALRTQWGFNAHNTFDFDGGGTLVSRRRRSLALQRGSVAPTGP